MHKALRIAISLIPWALASYAFYWLDSSGTWTTDTAHRGKLSVMILAAGMAMSLLLYTWLSKRNSQ